MFKTTSLITVALATNLSLTALAECKIDQGSFTLSTHMVQKAVKGSNNETVRQSYTDNTCVITKGWEKGGEIPPNLPEEAEHITVKVPGLKNCYIYDHPDLFGSFTTICG